MATARIRVAAVLAVALVVNAAGCKDEGERLAPVGGVLTVQAKPVPNGTVTFYPDAAKGNATQHQPCGVVAADGRFELFVPGGRKGAPPGWYKVVVYAVDDPQPGKPNRYWVNTKYATPSATLLSVEVVENPEPGRYDRQLDR